jgi:hypothetical protein
MLRFISPHLRVETVLDLDVDRLRRLEIDSLLLDVDCTLKRYTDRSVSDSVAGWLNDLQAAGIGLCLVSNGLGKRIEDFAQGAGLPFVAKACKPLPRGCLQAVKRMGFDRRRTAIVGDQLFADIMAGRLAGLTSILVRPIHPEEEPWFTRLKRPPERFLLRWMGGSGE